MAFEPFMRWGFDFVRPIKPTTRYSRNQYIIVTIDYTTKWVGQKHFMTTPLKSPLNLFMNKLLLTLATQPIF